MDIKSPCIKVCEMDWGQDCCSGCGRTLEEIARWSAMSNAEKRAVLDRLKQKSAKQ